jgi:hypothetical protein
MPPNLEQFEPKPPKLSGFEALGEWFLAARYCRNDADNLSWGDRSIDALEESDVLLRYEDVYKSSKAAIRLGDTLSKSWVCRV